MKKFIGITSILIAVAIVTFLTMTQQEPEEEETETHAMQVQTIMVTPASVTDVITGHGQVKARWETTLASEVAGRVTYVSEKFLSGMAFEKGEVIATIDDTSYQAVLATAKANFANAKRQLKEEENRVKIAANNWQTSGLSGTASDLVLRKPQLAEAKAALSAAKAEVKKATYDLAQTKITLPYNGVIIDRQINPGDFVQMGSVLGRVYDRSIFEVRVPLNLTDIARLPKNIIGQQVTISKTHHDENWHGRISRIEQIIDAQNRWQNIVIEITETQNLLPGSFVEVDIQGRNYAQALTVSEDMPASDGYMWYVDKNEQLQRFMPEILFQKDGDLYVQAPFEDLSPLRMTIGRDLFLPNIAVQATEFTSEMAHMAEHK